ncbi:MAG: DUF4418 family protein [Planctomycetota bacterium]|nr:DUF4418 family protein [Planctomycetota bacterium]
MDARHLAGGLPFLILGSALAVLPQTLFPACPLHGANGPEMAAMHSGVSTGGHGAVPVAAPANPNRMPCFFTARSASGLGAVVVIAGLAILASPLAALWRGVSILAIPAAALALAFLHWLIGVCAMPAMVCRQGLAPAINVLAALSILAALVNIFWLSRTGAGGKLPAKTPIAVGAGRVLEFSHARA